MVDAGYMKYVYHYYVWYNPFGSKSQTTFDDGYAL